MVASAHGDLQSLLENPELNTLVGGTTSVTLGDAMASATNAGNKVRQREGAKQTWRYRPYTRER